MILINKKLQSVTTNNCNSTAKIGYYLIRYSIGHREHSLLAKIRTKTRGRQFYFTERLLNEIINSNSLN